MANVNGTIIAYGEITILDLLDDATYIYYADDGSGSGASLSPTGKSYIGIYSGSALSTGQPNPDTDNYESIFNEIKWSKYVGEKGKDGVGIKSATITYQCGSSDTDPPSDAWHETVAAAKDAYPDAPFLWAKTYFVLDNDEERVSYSVAANGEDGLDGDRFLIETSQKTILKFQTKSGLIFSPGTIDFVVYDLSTSPKTKIALTADNYYAQIQVAGDFYDIPDNYIKRRTTLPSSEETILEPRLRIAEYYDYLSENYTTEETEDEEQILLNRTYTTLLESSFYVRLVYVEDGKDKAYLPIEIRNGVSSDMAEFNINAGGFNAAVNSGKLEYTAEGLTITNGGLTILGANSENLLEYNQTQNKLIIQGDGTFSGELKAATGSFSGDISASGVFSGKVVADQGKIGGFEIGQNYIKSIDDNLTLYSSNEDYNNKSVIKVENIEIGSGAKITDYIQLGTNTKLYGSGNGKSQTIFEVNNGASLFSISDNGKLCLGEQTNPNLYTGSDSFSGSNWKNLAAWTDTETTDSLGNKVFSKTLPWGGLYQVVPAKLGQTFTWSANIKTSGKVQTNIYYNEYDANLTSIHGGFITEKVYIDQPETRIFGTYTIQKEDCEYVNIRIEQHSNTSGTLYVSSLKLEEDNVATSWCLASEAEGYLILDGSSQTIKSSTFIESGTGAGWSLSNGKSYFNDVIVRGKLESAVFETGKVSAVGGILLIRPSTKIAAIDGMKVTLEDATGFEGGADTAPEYYYISPQGDATDAYYYSSESAINKNVITLTEELDSKYIGASIVSYGRKGSVGLGINGSTNESALPASSFSVFEWAPQTDKTKGLIYQKNYKVVLGKIPGTSKDYGGLGGTYGLYADNVYLKGSLVTGTDNTYSGMKTSNGSPNSTHIFEEKGAPILLWAGATGTTEEEIKKAPFFVDQNGNLYAAAGQFEGTIITNAQITASVLKTAEIKGDEDNHALVVSDDKGTVFQTLNGKEIMMISAEGVTIGEGYGLTMGGSTLSGAGEFSSSSLFLKNDTKSSVYISLPSQSGQSTRGRIDFAADGRKSGSTNNTTYSIIDTTDGLSFNSASEKKMTISSNNVSIKTTAKFSGDLEYGEKIRYVQVKDSSNNVIGYDLYI